MGVSSMQLLEANGFSIVSSLLFSSFHNNIIINAHRAVEVESPETITNLKQLSEISIQNKLNEWYNIESRKRFLDKDTTSIYLYHYGQLELVSILSKICNTAGLDENYR